MTMEYIDLFINELRRRGGIMWLENSVIKLSTPKELQNQKTKNFILQNKNEITSILYENFIFTKKDFFNKKILKYNKKINYPLSSSQDRLWFIEQYERGTYAYHIP
ncbi:hypothetical protein, partial [uncultured Aquimarina sp.]|uniref:hypothetical protein n=1 Tax=uncultured Aquimarina sp. TaxID=575652 RepID=UPI002615A888